MDRLDDLQTAGTGKFGGTKPTPQRLGALGSFADQLCIARWGFARCTLLLSPCSACCASLLHFACWGLLFAALCCSLLVLLAAVYRTDKRGKPGTGAEQQTGANAAKWEESGGKAGNSGILSKGSATKLKKLSYFYPPQMSGRMGLWSGGLRGFCPIILGVN